MLAVFCANVGVIQTKYFVWKYRHSELSMLSMFVLFISVNLLSMVRNVKKKNKIPGLLVGFEPANTEFKIPDYEKAKI